MDALTALWTNQMRDKLRLVGARWTWGQAGGLWLSPVIRLMYTVLMRNMPITVNYKSNICIIKIIIITYIHIQYMVIEVLSRTSKTPSYNSMKSLYLSSDNGRMQKIWFIYFFIKFSCYFERCDLCAGGHTQYTQLQPRQSSPHADDQGPYSL